MLSLSQRMSQQQRLSPQQIQYQKLLQLNTLALEQRIKTELEINPILEEVMEGESELSQETDEKDKEKSDDTVEEEIVKDADKEEFEIEDFMNDADFESERVNKSGDDENYQPLAPNRVSLSEHLEEQLTMMELDEDMFLLGQEIIGNLDDDGYLKRSIPEIINELSMFANTNIPLDKAEKLLKQIQTFDPIGIGARSLQECLLIQLRNIKHDPYYTFLAEELLNKYFDDFAKRRYDAIMLKMNLSNETLKAVLDLIQSLNPKPGEGNIASQEMNQITPDFVIERVDDNFVITLNDRSVPSVTISKSYLEMFQQNKKNKKSEREKDTYKFLREKFESAKWFIACIQQRRETFNEDYAGYSRAAI